MHHAMTYCLDILKCAEHTELLVKKSVEDSLDTYCVVLDRHLLNELFLICSLMLKTSGLHSDSFNDSLCKKIVNFIVLHIEKLILQ